MQGSSTDMSKHNPIIMVKGIMNYQMALCLAINLRTGSNWAIILSPIFATGYVCFATTFLYQVANSPGGKFLLHVENVNF